MAAIELESTPLRDDANLVSYWRFEGNSLDETTSNNDGTDTSITYGASTGKFGQGAAFNGTSSYITCADSATLSLTNPYTLSFWLYPNNVTTNARGEVFSKWVSSGSNLSYLLYQKASSGYLVFNHSNNGSSTLASEFTQTNREMTASTWNHCVLVVSGTTGTFYINGAAATDNGQALFSSTYDSTAAFNIGVRNDGALESYFSGKMDDIAFFSRALTATEISNLYNGTFFKPTVMVY